MLVLFDQGTPVPIRRHLSRHTVRTTFEHGWDALANGELLAAAEREGYEVFVTTDQNLRHQQDLSSRRIAIVVITRGQWPRLAPHVNLVVASVDAAVPGGYTEVEIPTEHF
jgi:hypothetical protein